MKSKDLTGQRFGRLVVLELDPEPYQAPSGKPARRWKCRCDCGTELTVLQNALTGANGTRSCGCARRDSMRALGHDLSGERFGRLTVLQSVELETPKANGLRQGWLCRCDCGREKVLTQKDLELTGVQSCGCLLSDTARDKIVVKNLVGHYKGTTISAIRPTRPPNKNNTSGVKGVSWSEHDGVWVASIGYKGRNIYLGKFSCLEDAKKARLEAEGKYYSPVIKEYDTNFDVDPPPD